MVLGEGARDQGATADHISELTPGVAFVRVEGTRAIRRVRASYLTDDDIAELAATVTASPALSAPRPPKPVDPLDGFDLAQGVQPNGSSSRPPQRKPRKPRARAASGVRDQGGDQ
jgi:DNA segregation ATPase FtsK/SpoIIIE, S-DNA-T family